MIEYKGIFANNIKNENVTFPENKIVCISGISGSGKSSLAFDVIHAMSNNALLELAFPKLSQYGLKIKSPKVESVNKIIPSFAFKQISNNHNKRSTIGTFTNISNVMRELFSYINSINNKYISAKLFSYNTPEGACEHCHGIGETCEINIDSVLDYDKTIEDNPFKLFKSISSKDYHHKLSIGICKQRDISVNIKLSDLKENELNFILYGGYIKEFIIKYRLPNKKLREKKIRKYNGILEDLIKYKNSHNMSEIINGKYSSYFYMKKCKSCNGFRLKNEILKYKVCGLNFAEMESLSFIELSNWISEVKNKYIKHKAITNILSNLEYKIKSLIYCNLSYLSLSRTIPSLSGGEYNRIRFAQAMFLNISNSLFIFDEPSAGLHPKDIFNIFESIKSIVNYNNSILIVEHNEFILKNCDYIIDIGPYAGVNGGKVLYMGDLEGLKSNNISETSKFLFRKNGNKNNIHRLLDKKINFYNLKNNNVYVDKITLYKNVINVLVGVSGSGKSSVLEIIFDKIKNNDFKSDINNSYTISPIIIDQSPIGKNSRSIVATYVGVWELIRLEFSKIKNENNRSKPANYFSFNTDNGGRCQKCKGDGVIKHNFALLEDEYIECDECNGLRYSKDALSIKYKDKNISDILNSSIDESILIFNDNEEIKNILTLLSNIGIGYITLGQPSNSLSGGEAQRIKLASELINKNKNKVYIIDEPTLGLHHYDIEKLIVLFNNIISNNNTIICADHNIEFISNCDYILEIGPGGGNEGGKLVAFGNIDSIKNNKSSIIGKYLN